MTTPSLVDCTVFLIGCDVMMSWFGWVKPMTGYAFRLCAFKACRCETRCAAYDRYLEQTA